MIVVIGRYYNFKRWGAARPNKVGKWLSKHKRFEKAVNVQDETSLHKVIIMEDLNELVVLDKNRNVDLSIIRQRISVNRLLSR